MAIWTRFSAACSTSALTTVPGRNTAPPVAEVALWAAITGSVGLTDNAIVLYWYSGTLRLTTLGEWRKPRLNRAS